MELAVNESRQICRFSRHFRQKNAKEKERSSRMEFRSLELYSLLVVGYGCLANANNLEFGSLAALLASS